MTDDPLIVTAAFDAGSAAVLQDLRDRHFPPERNIVPAHLTLFHHLPGSALPSVLANLLEVAAITEPFRFMTGAPRFLGRGCALAIDAPGLERLRAGLAAGWRGWLTPQDCQPFRPHVTVQNKVAPTIARALCDALSGLPAISGRIEGVDLWFYRGGPWERARRIGLGQDDANIEPHELA